MRKIRELLRLKFDLGLSIHKIAASLSIARSTVTECLRRAAAAGIGWPLPPELDDGQLEARLYPKKPASPNVAMPDFSHLQRELARPGVTRLLLWQEYKAQHPDGLQYSAFCDHFRAFLSAREPVMGFEHRAGEKCFVDYAGQTAEVIDRTSGEVRQAQIFVAVLGCSNVSGNPTAFFRFPGKPGECIARFITGASDAEDQAGEAQRGDVAGVVFSSGSERFAGVGVLSARKDQRGAVSALARDAEGIAAGG
jgi:hypothetical protein